jgi:hypothetical protein
VTFFGIFDKIFLRLSLQLIGIALALVIRMRIIVRLLFVVLLITSVFMTSGCGVDGLFVTGDGSEANTKSELSAENVADLDVNLDDENTVRRHLTALKDKDFDISVSEHRQSVTSSLQYAVSMLKRSKLLPKEERSKCSCEYQLSTFKLAVELIGEYAHKLNQQTIGIKKREEPKTYKEIYASFNTIKEYLTDLSTLDVEAMMEVASDEQPLTEIQSLAKSYLKKLSSSRASDDSDDTAP